MNGQPPSSPYPPPQIILPSQGMGCFAKGCLTLLIVGFILMVAMICGTWFIFIKTVDNLTSSAPADVQMDPPTESQFQSAENSMAGLRKAIASNEETTVAFTGDELNALLARDLDFKEWRGRTRIEIADSIMTVTLSAPLNSIPLPRLKNRWFNGTARLKVSYQYGTFDFDIHSAEAGGHQVPSIFLSTSALSTFNESMNQDFRDELKNNNRRSEFWNHVKTMSLEGDKLIVTTLKE